MNEVRPISESFTPTLDTPAICRTTAGRRAKRSRRPCGPGWLYVLRHADVASLTGDAAYVQAIDRIWKDVVTQKLYLTGGIGALHRGEAFGPAYELPNHTAYTETCAAIANIFWNQRMFLLHGQAKYLDVLERTLYNGFLSGISMQGDSFLYNPLASDGQFMFNRRQAAGRSAWFDCSCCRPTWSAPALSTRLCLHPAR